MVRKPQSRPRWGDARVERFLRLPTKRTVFLASLLAAFTAGAALDLNAAEVLWLRDQALKISFAYHAPWRPVHPVESATSYVVNWEGKGGGLVAMCYLQSYDDAKYRNLPALQLPTMEKEIVALAMKNMAIRFPRNRLISSQSSTIDGQPVIWMIRDGEGENLGKVVGLRSWLVVTVWHQKLINFECASPVPHQFPGHSLVEIVEKEVLRVIRTLHFER
jgi:hypothetical protein